MWYMYTTEYHPAIKGNKVGSFVKTQMDQKEYHIK